MNTQLSLLSKWWQTDSCERAMERAAKARAERIAQIRKQFAAKQKALADAANNWEVK